MARASRLLPFPVAAFWGLMLARPFDDIDLYWHLNLGRAVLRAGSRVVPEPAALEPFARRCVVHEWLWDVAVYGAHQLLGLVGVALLVIATTALAGFATATLAESWDDEPSPITARVIAISLVTPIVLGRVRERPETVAFALLAMFLLLARRIARPDGQRRMLREGMLLLLVSVIWAQIHASVVLAPIVLVVAAGPELARADRRMTGAAMLVATTLATLTTAHGLGLPQALLVHKSAYVAAHIAEWGPPTWNLLDPDKTLHAPFFAVAWLLVLALVAYTRRVPARELRVALVGVLLVLQARRGFGFAGIFLTPLLVRVFSDGIDAVRVQARSRLALVAALVAAVSLGRTAWFIHDRLGPLGHLGSDAGIEPSGAASLLRAAPPGARLLTSQRASGSIAYWLDGHARTFVDGRVPLLFDPSELALARAIWSVPAALANSTAVFQFDVAVVEHTLPLCETLAASPSWAPVLIEGRFATFARRGTGLASKPLEHLHPCTHGVVDHASCAGDGGRALADEIASTGAHADRAFVAYLDAERMVYCSDSSIDADAVLHRLAPRSEARAFLPMQDSLLAFLNAASGQVGVAASIIAPHVAEGRAWVLSRSLAAMTARGADEELRPLLERIARERADETPPWVQIALANLCARRHDGACAALYGLPAGVNGSYEVAPALCWLAHSHDRAETRAEATALLTMLRARGGAESPPRAVDCR